MQFSGRQGLGEGGKLGSTVMGMGFPFGLLKTGLLELGRSGGCTTLNVLISLNG